MPVDTETLSSLLSRTITATSFDDVGERYEGKVRDSYTRSGVRYMIATDRVSAFDRVLGTVPLKGQVLTRLSAYWFEAARAKGVADSHYLGTPDPNVTACVPCAPLPVEIVVRAYVTGNTSTSMWTHYARGARTFAGHVLPDGLHEHQKLERPLVTPATKAAKGEHDVTVSRAELVSAGAVTARDFDAAAELCLALFDFGARHCAAQGLLLADTKYEVGTTPDGRIVVIDEIHTPDSSRFWLADSYAERLAAGQAPESLDKDYVRRFLAATGYVGDGAPPPLPDDVRVGAAERYVRAFERITGEAFVPDLDAPLPRIAANLARAAGG